MSKQPRNRKHKPSEGSELDQFEAYGSYSYEYMHQPKDEEEGFEPEEHWEEAYESKSPRRAGRIPLEGERLQRRTHAFWGRLLFLAVFAVITVVVLQDSVFRLKDVYVVGNEKKTKEYVVSASGLLRGLNIFAINEDEVRENLSKDHTIQFLRIQKELPSTVYIYISERVPVASMQLRGFLYTLDADGMVMEESSALLLPEGLPVVTGFQDVTTISVGQTLEMKDKRQLAAFQLIMSELNLQLYTDQISELNVYDVDNLYLLMVDGITIRLGSSQHARAKIGAVRTDMAYLRQLGKTSGILDVSIPEDAKYTPGS